jgi:hypothetical protein
MTGMDRLAAIERYEQGLDELRAALAGITNDELDARPADGAWTAREIAHHVADSEANSYVRLRRLLADEAPQIQGYDETRWARSLHYGDRPIEPSLAVVDAVRAASAQLLRALREDEWGATGWHSESGAYSLASWLEIYANHAHDHADQIRRARAGRP